MRRMEDRNELRSFQRTAQNEPKIIAICEICKSPIYEGHPYIKIPLQENKYVHLECAMMCRAKMFAIGAWLRG
jgi:hypothetical protein